jgi:hypothetical protein
MIWTELQRSIQELTSKKEEHYYAKKSAENSLISSKIRILSQIQDCFLRVLSNNEGEGYLHSVTYEKKQGYTLWLEDHSKILRGANSLVDVVDFIPHYGSMVGFCPSGLYPPSFIIETLLKPDVNENVRASMAYSLFLRVIPSQGGGVDVVGLIRKEIAVNPVFLSDYLGPGPQSMPASKIGDFQPERLCPANPSKSPQSYCNYISELFDVHSRDKYSTLA